MTQTILITPEFSNVALHLDALPNETASIHFVSPVEIALEDNIIASGNTDSFDGADILIFHGPNQFGTIAQAGNFSSDKEAVSTSRDFFLIATGQLGVRHVLSDIRLTVTKP